MKYSVCVDSLIKGQDTAQKLRDIKSAGAAAFEFWSWWDKDLPAVKKAADETGLTLVTMCHKFISLTDPSLRDAYKTALKESLGACKTLDCKTLISQVGNDTGKDRAAQHKSIVDGLKACAPLLEDAGITLLVEPLNTTIDHKGYYLWKSSEGFEIIDEVASPRVLLLYDIYHQQVMEGNILNSIIPNIDKIGHLHAAGLPGRCEVQNGELNYSFIVGELDKAGYSHYMGLEYFPKQDPLTGLKEFLAAQGR
jgi:hydroxypyruvate isomerase